MLTAPDLDTAFDTMRREAPSTGALASGGRDFPSASESRAWPSGIASRPVRPVEDDFDSMWEDGLVASW